MTWKTSQGDRILRHKEGILFLTAVRSMADWDYPWVGGSVPIWSQLACEQRWIALSFVTKHLIDGDLDAPQLNAWREATIYAVYDFIAGEVECEIDDEACGEEDYFWRRLVWDAAVESFDMEDPLMTGVDDSDLQHWAHFLCEELCDQILWDRDWELVVNFFTDEIDRSRRMVDGTQITEEDAVLGVLGIGEEYLDTVPPLHPVVLEEAKEFLRNDDLVPLWKAAIRGGTE
jgi:hypothetical protein